jgi:hypothetical protein
MAKSKKKICYGCQELTRENFVLRSTNSELERQVKVLYMLRELMEELGLATKEDLRQKVNKDDVKFYAE